MKIMAVGVEGYMEIIPGVGRRDRQTVLDRQMRSGDRGRESQRER